MPTSPAAWAISTKPTRVAIDTGVDGASVDPDALIAHVKERLAHYKAPKRVLPVETIGRAANGKVDYKRLKRHAADELQVELPA